MNNYAATRGGGLVWFSSKPTNAEKNTFSGNKAVFYGSNIAGRGERVALITQAEYEANLNTEGDLAPVSGTASSEISNHQSGSILEVKYAAAVDGYNQIVKYGLSSPIVVVSHLEEVNSIQTSASGKLSYSPERGVVKIDAATLNAAPNKTHSLYLTSRDLLDSTIQTPVKITVRSCVTGEELTGGGL